MKHALVLTGHDRPGYLLYALKGWQEVRGLDRWRVVISIDPGQRTDAVLDLARDFHARTKHPDFSIVVNPRRYGVLGHPYVAFDRLFADGHNFVLRTEDDILPSRDALEYFEWAEAHYRDGHPDVATIHGNSFTEGAADEVEVRPRFDSWMWGTWAGVWENFIEPTWDHDYSTFNDTPGNQSGWDWNLDTRVYPKEGLKGVFPMASRVCNIGVHGVHGTPENHRTSQSYRGDHGPVVYRERR